VAYLFYETNRDIQIGTTMTKVLAALDALDRHSFDRMEANNLDSLYSKVFPNVQPPTVAEQKERQENVSINMIKI